VSEDKRRLVLDAQVPAECQGALALDLIAENHDGREVGPDREFVEREQRAAGEAKILSACLAAVS
jgi:hypothetical protein